MTALWHDVSLAIGAAFALLAYASVGVASFRLSQRRRQVPWWHAVGVSAASLCIYVAVLLVMLLVATAVAVRHRSLQTATWFLVWSIFGGIAALAGVISPAYANETPELFYCFRAIAWPLAITLGWVLRVAVGAAVRGARVPERCGVILADVVAHRQLSREAKEARRIAVEQRVTEREKALGIGDEQ